MMKWLAVTYILLILSVAVFVALDIRTTNVNEYERTDGVRCIEITHRWTTGPTTCWKIN